MKTVINYHSSVIGKIVLLMCVFSSFAAFSFAQTGKIADVAAQASQVTEFDVNGMKVLVKRRASAPTVAVGLFIKAEPETLMTKTPESKI